MSWSENGTSTAANGYRSKMQPEEPPADMMCVLTTPLTCTATAKGKVRSGCVFPVALLCCRCMAILTYTRTNLPSHRLFTYTHRRPQQPTRCVITSSQALFRPAYLALLSFCSTGYLVGSNLSFPIRPAMCKMQKGRYTLYIPAV